MDELHTRVRYLEKVVSNILSNRTMAKNRSNKNSGGDQTTPPEENQNQGVNQDAPVAFKLKYPKSEVKDPRSGKLTTVTEEILLKDPVLLKHMLEKHADCFTEIGEPAEEVPPPAEEEEE